MIKHQDTYSDDIFSTFQWCFMKYGCYVLNAWKWQFLELQSTKRLAVKVLVFNDTFNNITVISLRSVVIFIVGGNRHINRKPQICRESLRTLSHNVVSSIPFSMVFHEIWMLRT
jgi:hypothetical protein